MFTCLKVIAAAKFMFSHLTANGYQVGGLITLSHDLGDHVASYLFWGEVSLLPLLSTIKGEGREQVYLAESLADLARFYVQKGVVTDRLLLYGNTSGDSISEDAYEWYVTLMKERAHPKLLESLRWWYRQIS